MQRLLLPPHFMLFFFDELAILLPLLKAILLFLARLPGGCDATSHYELVPVSLCRYLGAWMANYVALNAQVDQEHHNNNEDSGQ